MISLVSQLNRRAVTKIMRNQTVRLVNSSNAATTKKNASKLLVQLYVAPVVFSVGIVGGCLACLNIDKNRLQNELENVGKNYMNMFKWTNKTGRNDRLNSSGDTLGELRGDLRGELETSSYGDYFDAYSGPHY